MALVECPECKNSISDKAISCPKCGCPISVTDVLVDGNNSVVRDKRNKGSSDSAAHESFGSNISTTITDEELRLDEIRRKAKAQAKRSINIIENQHGHLERKRKPTPNEGMSPVSFVVLYVIFMIPTYAVRWSGIVIAFGLASEASTESSFNSLGLAVDLLLIIFLLILCVIAYQRGKAIERKFLVIFPVVAIVFDVIIPIVPFIPTVMHVSALVVGVISSPSKK